jgi:hypothetical protein
MVKRRRKGAIIFTNQTMKLVTFGKGKLLKRGNAS